MVKRSRLFLACNYVGFLQSLLVDVLDIIDLFSPPSSLSLVNRCSEWNEARGRLIVV